MVLPPTSCHSQKLVLRGWKLRFLTWVSIYLLTPSYLLSDLDLWRNNVISSSTATEHSDKQHDGFFLKQESYTVSQFMCYLLALNCHTQDMHKSSRKTDSAVPVGKISKTCNVACCLFIRKGEFLSNRTSSLTHLSIFINCEETY